jgi:hypothetical protein
MTSYPETLTVKKLIKMGFFTIKIYYISSSNDPNITQTKNHICGWSQFKHYRAADGGQPAVIRLRK